MKQSDLKKRWIDCSIPDCPEQARWYRPGNQGIRRIFYCRTHRQAGTERLPHKHDLEWAPCADCSTPFLRPAAGGGRGRYCPEHRHVRQVASLIEGLPTRTVACHLKLLIEGEDLLITDTIAVPLLRQVTYRDLLMRLMTRHADALRRLI